MLVPSMSFGVQNAPAFSTPMTAKPPAGAGGECDQPRNAGRRIDP
jgi:hypothetical protein